MAAPRPTSEPADVTPTEAGPTDAAAVAVADPALAAPDSQSPAVVETPVATTPAQQVVYVQAPKPFVNKSNRGFGILIAVLSTVIFAALTAVGAVLTQLIAGVSTVSFDFITTLNFYAPTIMFLVGFVIVVIVLNRAGWPAHVVGSIVVGLIVLFGGTGLLLLINISAIPSNRVELAFTNTIFSPQLIIAAILGREVSLWMGAFIASRGRKVKERNVEAKVLYDQEVAAKRAEYEQANAAAGVPTPSGSQPAVVAQTGAVEPVVVADEAPAEVAPPQA